MKKFSFPQFTLSLKTRLIAGSLAISVLSLLLAIGAVIFMINKQQTTAAHALIKNALTIMTDELRARQEKLFADTRQLAQMEGISTKIKFLLPQKTQANDVSMLNTYQELTNAVYNIGVTANASTMAIYDRDGDVAAFMLKRPTDMVIGYASGFPSPVFQILTATSGNAPQNENWRAETEVAGIAPTFGRPIPAREQTRIEQREQEICLVAYVPVMGQIFEKEKRKMETTQLGVAVAIQPLDEAFISRMARLTNTAPQIFTPQGLSVGEIPDYRAFDWERLPAAATASASAFDMNALLLNDVSISDRAYFQGSLPLTDGGAAVGALAALHSKEVARANTLEMIRALLLVGLGCAVLSAPLALLFSHSLQQPISMLAKIAHSIAEGDLTHDIALQRSDEIGVLAEAFRTMMTTLTDVVSKVKAAANHIADEGRVLQASTEQMAQGASQQAAASEESSAAMEQMSANLRQTADNAKAAEQIALKSAAEAQQGGDAVSKIVTAMQTIEERIAVIQQIALQTNLLSMNATIEAAKAQDYGKGFAVVASEVRTLANYSRDAASEIERLVKSCVGITDEAGQILQRLVPNSEKTAHIVQEICAATLEQHTGTEQVNQAVQQLDAVIQQNAGITEQLAATAESLSTQAEALQELIAFFTVRERRQETPNAPDTRQLMVKVLQSLLSGEEVTPALSAELITALSAVPPQTPESFGKSEHEHSVENVAPLSASTGDNDALDDEFEHF